MSGQSRNSPISVSSEDDPQQDESSEESVKGSEQGSEYGEGDSGGYSEDEIETDSSEEWFPIDLTDEEKKWVKEEGSSLVTCWGGDWLCTSKHGKYERRTHTEDLHLLQHSHTDIFFRNLFYACREGYMIKADTTLKLRLLEDWETSRIEKFVNDKGKAIKLLDDFVQEGNNEEQMKKFSEYSINEDTTSLSFRVLVAGAKSILDFAHGRCGAAYRTLKELQEDYF